jgi:hypothetical protein
LAKKYKNKFNPQYYVRIAKDLHYSDKAIEHLEKAENEEACDRILRDARKGVI